MDLVLVRCFGGPTGYLIFHGAPLVLPSSSDAPASGYRPLAIALPSQFHLGRGHCLQETFSWTGWMVKIPTSKSLSSFLSAQASPLFRGNPPWSAALLCSGVASCPSWSLAAHGWRFVPRCLALAMRLRCLGPENLLTVWPLQIGSRRPGQGMPTIQ